MKRIKMFMLSIFLFSFLPGIVLGQVPRVISYQGRLSDASGSPVTGTHDITFKLYTTATGGSPIWTETHTGVQIINGLYNVMLGSITPLFLSDVNFSQQYWLGVTIDTTPEMTPRYQLGASPYALNIADTIRSSTHKFLVFTDTSHGLIVFDSLGTSVVGYTYSSRPNDAGVYGFAGGGSYAQGVIGVAQGSGYGVFAAYGPTNHPSAGLANRAYAGYFDGKVVVTDTLRALHIATSDTFQYVVSCFAFQPSHSNIQYSFLGIKMTLTTSPSSNVFFNAPLPLPQGALVKKMIAYWYDDDATHDITIELYRGYYYGNTPCTTLLGSISSSGSAGAGESSVDISHTVNYNSVSPYYGYSYKILVLYPAGINTS
ncbi:MAG: hypothetical protein ACPL6C_01830, partial [bacterium]